MLSFKHSARNVVGVNNLRRKKIPQDKIQFIDNCVICMP